MVILGKEDVVEQHESGAERADKDDMSDGFFYTLFGVRRLVSCCDLVRWP